MLQLNLNPSHATQILQNTLELNCKNKTCRRWEHRQATWEGNGPTAQACRDGIRTIKAQTKSKMVRNVKGNKSLTGTAPTNGRPEWAHCWTGMEMKNEEHRKTWGTHCLLCLKSSLARSPLRSPTLLRLDSGGKKYYQHQRKTKVRTNCTYNGAIYTSRTYKSWPVSLLFGRYLVSGVTPQWQQKTKRHTA